MNMTVGAHPAMPDEASLWERHATRIYRYLLRLTGKWETAEDLTQETFVQAILHLRRTGERPENEKA